MTFGIIYKLTNMINNKVYIGQTTYALEKRWAEHKSFAKTTDSKIAHAIRKYGAFNFKHEVICECADKIELDRQEIYYIAKYDSVRSGYNLTSGGFCGNRQSIETCQKKSNSQKKACADNPELKERRTKGFKQYWITATKEQLQDRANKIKAAWTPERRAMMTRIHSGKHRDNSACVKARIIPIQVINEITQEIHQFTSCQEACKILNLTASAVTECLKGRRARHKGFLFRYL